MISVHHKAADNPTEVFTILSDLRRTQMEISTQLAAKVASLTMKVGKFAIERWTIFRRDQFFESLLENLQIEQASGEKRPEVDEALDELLKNDQNSEVLFDAYRRVCFSKTKKYGPRIIGLLTAELLNNSITSDDDEEMIFAAAELLGDVDFADFYRYYENLLKEVAADEKLKRDVMRSGDELTEIVSDDGHEVGSHINSETHLMPTDLRISHGAWAALLQSCGLVSLSVTQQTRHIKEDSERYIDYDQTWVTTVVSMVYKPAVKRLFLLLERARANNAN